MSRGMKIFLVVSFVLALIFVGVPLVGYLSRPDVSAQSIQPVQSTPEQKHKAEECGKLLSNTTPSVWGTMKLDGDLVDVVVGPAFEQMDYDTRLKFVSVTACYYTDGRMDDTVKTIEFLDPHTHQPIGHWYKGLELKFDR